MGRKRQKDTHMPELVYWHNNAWQYKKPHNTGWIKLGKTLSEAMQKWSELFEVPLTSSKTMEGVFNRYEKEILPQKAETTARNERYNIRSLRTYFRDMIPDTITPVDIYGYLDIRKKVSIFSANKDLSIFSDICQCMVRWGVIKTNPCRDVERFSEPRRERTVEDDELNIFFDFLQNEIKIIDAKTKPNRNDTKKKECCITLQLAMQFYDTIALRKFDLLTILRSQAIEKGLHVRINKVKKNAIYKWTEYFSDLVQKAINISIKRSSLYLICQANGKPYTRSGFDSLRRRYMQKAVADGILKESFTFNDLRSKAADDAEKDVDIYHAQQLLVHETPKTTGRYLRRAKEITPKR